MRYVLGALLIYSGAMILGLAYHNNLADGWNALTGKGS